MSLQGKLIAPTQPTNPSKASIQQFVKDIVVGGRKARKIVISADNLPIGANADFPYAFDEVENGELRYFIVAVNDENMQLDCILYDDDYNPDAISDRTMREWTILGCGLTLSEAEAINPSNQSYDISGQISTTTPYISRYKVTYTGNPQDPTTVFGTEADKFIVLKYEPHIREEYSRIQFNIHNSSNSTQLVHHFKIARIKYIDIKSVPQSNPNEASINIM
jgi:hypothetical protein